MKQVITFLLIVIFPALLFGQKKSKKNPYAGYWEQQEKQEQFDKIAEEGHKLFQAKKYEEAKTKYNEALKVLPTDQRIIAKVRDINLLLEKRKAQKIDPINHEEIPDTLTLYLNDIVSVQERPALDTVQKSVMPFNETKLDTSKEKRQVVSKNSKEDSEAELKSIKKKSDTANTVKSKLEKPVIANKPNQEKAARPNPQPFKNTDNYRKYLATLHEQGWTEEAYEEGNKKVLKRVFIQGEYGEEYLKITHHYGAIFYFKNGESISYATWIAETEKKQKD